MTSRGLLIIDRVERKNVHCEAEIQRCLSINKAIGSSGIYSVRNIRKHDNHVPAEKRAMNHAMDMLFVGLLRTPPGEKFSPRLLVLRPTDAGRPPEHHDAHILIVKV